MSDLKPAPKPRKKKRVILTGIKPTAWEHPADRAALTALKNVPGLDAFIKAIFAIFSEKSLRMMYLASSVRVNEKQFAKLYKLHKEACAILDMDKEPELYVSQTPFLNAMAIGADNPFIVLNSATVSSMSDDEIITIIGHELAHIKSGHVLYKTVLAILLNVSLPMLLPILPAMITQALLFSIKAALLEWSRKSELSCDRAGLLVVQNTDVATQVEMKLAGGGDIKQMDLGEFVKQAEEYKEADGIGNTLTKILNTFNQTHPFPVVRVSELITWVRSGEYDTILRGDFEKQDQTWKESAEEAGKSYKDDVKDTFKSVTDSIKETTKKAKDIFDDLSGSKK